MTATVEDYYDGSRTFHWLGKFLDVPLDQVNFLVTQFTALILAGVLRNFLSPDRVSPTTRHVFGLVNGLLLGYFCFGRQVIHLAGLSTLSYIVMYTQNPRNMQSFVLVTALFYLSCVHFHRQIYDYASYTLDITGPLMVITQKVTSLAYNVHDGLIRSEKELTPTQRHQAVKQMPTPLEYFSFVFHFQALMAGPVIYYRDYMDFIHGRNLSKPRPSTANDQNSNDRNAIVQLPSPIFVVIKKVLASLLCALAFVIFIPLFPIDRLKDNDFLRDTSMFYKIRYLMIATMLVRFKYYHAWIFADAICNNSGLGFSGYDEKGKPQWDATSNVDVLGFEMSQSLKESIEHWNKGTNRWLRSLVYERVKHNKLVYTYVLSAIWHGFYPGYYLTFANGAFITVVSRVTRRKIRPYFLSSKATKFLYDTISFIVTRIVMAYITFSFVLLEFIPSIKVYLSLYMLPHIVGIAILLIAPRLPKVSSQTDTPETKSNASQELINGAARKSM
ncbi:lysophospholipid acyltransferase 6 isoform X2 [Megachile rotundata]|uniref:lysophospholipid acyltransferase 6 isoform X2 n=1 Tax=Megachile rotundata TaxID=143995 RepID=UPI003FD53954